MAAAQASSEEAQVSLSGSTSAVALSSPACCSACMYPTVEELVGRGTPLVDGRGAVRLMWRVDWTWLIAGASGARDDQWFV